MATNIDSNISNLTESLDETTKQMQNLGLSTQVKTPIIISSENQQRLPPQPHQQQIPLDLKTIEDEAKKEAQMTMDIQADMEESNTNLIINYLPPNMNEGQLAILFSPYGALENCKIVVDLNTGRSRGYGFVKYDNRTSAIRALKALNGYNVGGKMLKVAFARPQCKEIQNANLYITNIPLTYDANKLKSHFQQFGTIVECRILKDNTGKSRGVGFVRMDTHHHAINALNKRDQFLVEPGMPPITVKLAQRRAPRRWNRQQNVMGGGVGGGSGGVGQMQGQQRKPNFQQHHMNIPQKKSYYRPRNFKSMPQPQPNGAMKGGQPPYYPIYDPYQPPMGGVDANQYFGGPANNQF